MGTVTVRYIVDDVDASIAFYRDLLGFDEVMHPRTYLSAAVPRGSPADTERAEQGGDGWTTRCSCSPGSARSGDRTGDNAAAVAVGLQRSGRIITSAALLLAVVVGGFATSGIVFMKMIGIGMLVALLLDARWCRRCSYPRPCGCSAGPTGGAGSAASLVGAARCPRG